ncbi:MAG: hypothetical protein ACR5LF_13880 [Symbiopectobacterium sp.]
MVVRGFHATAGFSQQGQIVQVQLFDMFPHTAHYEVMTLLRRG